MTVAVGVSVNISTLTYRCQAFDRTIYSMSHMFTKSYTYATVLTGIFTSWLAVSRHLQRVEV